MGRFEISAAESIDDATLVLDPGWLESMHVNTIEPAPVEELAGEARQQQIASLDDIQWAVVEGSGKSAAAAQRGIRTLRLAPKVLPSRSRIATRTV